MSNRDERRVEPIPWLWLGLGALITTALLVGGVAWLLSFLAEQPAEAAAVPEPTIIVLTAPPRPTGTPTILRPTPTVLPTSTPQPTIDISVAPPELTAGYYATIVDTGGVGLTVRNGPQHAQCTPCRGPGRREGLCAGRAD